MPISTLTKISKETSGSYSIRDSFQSIISEATNTNLYDSLSISQLQFEKERAQPRNSPEDLDPEKSRSLVEKAFGYQLTKATLPILRNSQIRQSYRLVEETYFDLRSLLSLGLATDGQDLSFNHSAAKKPNNYEIFKFNLTMSPQNGLEPQLNLGEDFRLRYDLNEQAAHFECQFNF